MLSTVQSTRHLRQYLALLLFLYLIDGVALLCNINLPMALAYGPLLYFCYKSSGKEIVSAQHLHLFPFFIVLFIFLLFSLSIQFAVGYFNGLFDFYILILRLCAPLSLFLYSLVVLTEEFSFHSKKSRTTIELISVFNLLYGGVLTSQGLFAFFDKRASVLLLALLIVAITWLCLFLFRKRSYVGGSKETETEVKCIIGEKTADELTELLTGSLEQTELYRNPSITLEMLAERIAVPKHHLSYFLNRCLGKSFYQLIAEYRVSYAKKRLQEDRMITIEDLAYECGFNSKTSLNRYFKEFTGLAPSQYRLGARQL